VHRKLHPSFLTLKKKLILEKNEKFGKDKGINLRPREFSVRGKICDKKQGTKYRVATKYGPGSLPGLGLSFSSRYKIRATGSQGEYQNKDQMCRTYISKYLHLA